MPLKTIIGVPLCGIGNRLKFMASIKIIARKMKIDNVKIVWRETIDCNLSWETAFKRIPDIEVVKEEEIYQNKDDVLYFGYIHMAEILANIKELRRIKESILVIEGGHECKHPEIPLVDYLRQKSDFYKSIEWADDIESRLNKVGTVPRIALHYRHVNHDTDQADVKSNPFCNFSKHSPFSEFEAIIKKLKAKCFFISNSGYHKDYIKNNISRNKVVVLHPDESNDRSALESMKNSIVEFVLMSRCELIIGSYYSSFSDEASYFNLIPKYMPMCDSLKTNTLEPYVRNYHTVLKPLEMENALVLNVDMKTIARYL